MAPLDRRTLRGAHARYGEPQRVGFEDVADLPDLFRIRWGHRDDSVPAVILVREKSFSSKRAECLACRALAGAELGGDLFLPDSLRGRQSACDDPVTKLVGDPLTRETGAFELHRHLL